MGTTQGWCIRGHEVQKFNTWHHITMATNHTVSMDYTLII